MRVVVSLAICLGMGVLSPTPAATDPTSVNPQSQAADNGQSTVHVAGPASAPKGTDRDICGHRSSQTAIASCTRIINDRRAPIDIRDIALRNRGSFFQSNGDLDRAIEDYTTVLELSPGEALRNAKTYVNRGLAYAGKGDESRALADYDQAIQLDPTLSSAYVNRAA